MSMRFTRTAFSAPLDTSTCRIRCEVEFEPRLLHSEAESPDLDDIYAVLAERYNSGEHDVAARHNEHQP